MVSSTEGTAIVASASEGRLQAIRDSAKELRHLADRMDALVAVAEKLPASPARDFALLDTAEGALDVQHKLLTGMLGTLQPAVQGWLSSMGIQNVKVSGLATVYLSTTYWARKPEEAKDAPDYWPAACRAMKRAGWGDLVETRFNMTSTSARVRELIRAHEVEHPDIVLDVEGLRGLLPRTLQRHLSVYPDTKAKARAK